VTSLLILKVFKISERKKATVGKIAEQVLYGGGW